MTLTKQDLQALRPEIKLKRIAVALSSLAYATGRSEKVFNASTTLQNRRVFKDQIKIIGALLEEGRILPIIEQHVARTGRDTNSRMYDLFDKRVWGVLKEGGKLVSDSFTATEEIAVQHIREDILSKVHNFNFAGDKYDEVSRLRGFVDPSHSYNKGSSHKNNTMIIPKRKPGKYRLLTAPSDYKKIYLKNLSREITSNFPQDDRILAYRDGMDYVKFIKDSKFTHDKMLGLDLKDYYHQVSASKLKIAASRVALSQTKKILGNDFAEVSHPELIVKIGKAVRQWVKPLDFYDNTSYYNIVVGIYNSLFALESFALVTKDRASEEDSGDFVKHSQRALDSLVADTASWGTKLSDMRNDAQWATSLLVLGMIDLFENTGHLLIFHKIKYVTDNERKSVDQGMKLALATLKYIVPRKLKVGLKHGKLSESYAYANKPSREILESKEAILTARTTQFEQPLRLLDYMTSQLVDFVSATIPTGIPNLLNCKVEDKLAESFFTNVKETSKPKIKYPAPIYKVLRNHPNRFARIMSWASIYKSKEVKWRRSLPQGYPTSGVVANYAGLAIVESLEVNLKGVLGIKDVKVLMYSDNLQILYSYTGNPPEEAKRFLDEKVSKISADTIESEGFYMNVDKIESYDKEEKRILGLLLDQHGNARTSRKLMRTINQIVINLNKKESIVYKGKAYSRKDLRRLNGLQLWYARTLENEHSRKLIPRNF